MGWQFTPYAAPLAATAIFAVPLIGLVATQRGKEGAYTLIALFGTMLVWAGSYAIQLSSTDPGVKIVFHAIRFLGPAFVTLVFLLFALQLTGRSSLVTPGSVLILSLTPVTTTILVWTDVAGLHQLLFVDTSVQTIAGNQVLVVEYGPWYYLHAGYAIAVTVAAIALFTSHGFTAGGAVGKRARLFALSGVFPLAGSGIYVAGLTAIDWGPVTSIASGLLIVTAIFYY